MSTIDNLYCVATPISLNVESVTPPVVLTRALQHHDELNLSDATIRRLLRVSRRHHEAYLRLAAAFVNISAQLDLTEARVDLRAHGRRVARHAQLFRRHEDLLLQAYEEARRILTPEQLRGVIRIHQRQKERVLAQLLPGLQRMLRPRFAVRRQTRPRR